jgi:hypothetical protein
MTKVMRSWPGRLVPRPPGTGWRWVFLGNSGLRGARGDSTKSVVGACAARDPFRVHGSRTSIAKQSLPPVAEPDASCQ